MKKSALIRIIVFGSVALLLTAALLVGIFTAKQGNLFGIISEKIGVIQISPFGDLSDYTEGDKSFEESEIKTIDIDWHAGSIEFKPQDGGEISISDDGKENKLCWQLNTDGTLHIAPYRENITSTESKKLTVAYPEGKGFEAVIIDCAAAYVNIDKLTAVDADINSASGNVKINNSKITTLSFDSAAGSLTTDKLNCKELSINTMSGNCDLSGEIGEVDIDAMACEIDLDVSASLRKCDVDAAGGSVTLFVDKNTKGFSLERTSLGGEFNSEVEGRHDGDRFIYGDGSAEIDIDALGGTVSVLEKK